MKVFDIKHHDRFKAFENITMEDDPPPQKINVIYKYFSYNLE